MLQHGRKSAVRAFIVCVLLISVPAGLRAEGDEDVSPYREMKTLARALELVRMEYVDEGKTDYDGVA